MNSSDSESYVILPLLLYKGYRATDQDTKQELRICPSANNEVMVVLPTGYKGALDVRFVSPFYWRIAELISLVVVLMISVFAWKNWRAKCKK